MKNTSLFILTIIVFATACCSVFRQVAVPTGFPAVVYDFKKNPTSAEVIALGKSLFYDGILSQDGSISCASCHSPFNAFAHTDHDLSHGINDQIGTRNAPPLFNLAWHKSFMWDGAINHLDVQALAPITHAKEMNENISNIIQKLQKTKLYPALFYKAYRDSIINSQKVLKALAQFQISLVSANSKYDRVKAGKDVFTAQEQNGYALFLKNCNACHTEPLFSSYEFANNGLPVDNTLQDVGKYKTTNLPTDSLKFKIPTLRNLSYTFPYMHDGRFKKLSQVLNHYTKGVQASPTLAPEIRQGISLTSNEKVDLIAFLLTLDDKEFVFNPKHQFPKELLSVER